ncbi:hypothetical protein TTHERM_00328530 (macronuclear) [Tetrahymena thermophila SB210]|uniref:Uncharacterized protein n=1 Tax=Tetrahymena thermophila (strain SB210) TaxID=312017 RepID=I7MMR7_TETTS|nr:hypothetical protein TTHERM_00328530 [Tetrahymena thermophila SB210]EAS06272.1 hypothetical protein TTHERM_00328530 [Tetrahymena thermophila SB210]|eukprot:XP_001026517.1 hypothetical protein TTHERM_00328530 [Tetrahymena thermophila SB210]
MNFQRQSTVFSSFEEKAKARSDQIIYEPEFFLDIRNHQEEQFQQHTSNQAQYHPQLLLTDSNIRYLKKLKSFSCQELQSVKLSEVQKKFNRYMKIHSFNNSVIKYVLTHKYYKILFNQYYEDGSLEKWVSKSKVNNKDMLRDWVNYLVKCIQNPKLLEDLSISQPQLKNIIIKDY